jgi:hypothetical protein
MDQTLWILGLALVWRFAARPFILRRHRFQFRLAATPRIAMYLFIAIVIVEVTSAAVVMLLLVTGILATGMAWTVLAILLVGQELRFWLFRNYRAPESPATHL